MEIWSGTSSNLIMRVCTTWVEWGLLNLVILEKLYIKTLTDAWQALSETETVLEKSEVSTRCRLDITRIAFFEMMHQVRQAFHFWF